MEDTPAIRVEGLTKYYGDFRAVDQVSFEVRQGELFGFLGPNGAGKTTTVRMLTGIMPASAGRATVQGYPAGSLQAKQRSGVVPELANAYLDLSAWDNLMLMAALYRVRIPDAKRRAGELLQDVGLYEKKASLVKTLSLGMRKRLLLCLALVSEPAVLFLDEPTSGLDVQSARLIRGRLRTLKTAGTTIFLTTHNMEEANELCDRVAIITHGTIVAIDTPARLRIGSGQYHVVEICFDQPVAPGFLSQLCGVDGIEGGETMWRISTADACGFVGILVDFSRAHALRLVALNILTPSLEDAFVRLTEEGGHAQ